MSALSPAVNIYDCTHAESQASQQPCPEHPSPQAHRDLQKAQAPHSMRSRFLEEIAGVPPHFLQHLQQFIPSVSSTFPSSQTSSKRSIPSSSSMDVDSNTYESTGESHVESSDARTELINAAQERTKLAHRNESTNPDQTQKPLLPAITAIVWYADALETHELECSNVELTYKSWATTAVSRW